VGLEPPSRSHQDTAESLRSSAAQPPSEARAHLTAGVPCHADEAKGAQGPRRSGDGPCFGRDGEQEHSAQVKGKRPEANIIIRVPKNTAELYDRLAMESGLHASHFKTVSLALGVAALTGFLQAYEKSFGSRK